MYWIWTLFYVIFLLHAGRTEKLMKCRNIVRKQARTRCWIKAGSWRVKISVHSLSCCLKLTWCCLLANYTALICFRLRVTLCCAMGRQPYKDQDKVIDKIGTKKQEEKRSVLTLPSLMLKSNRNRTFDAMTETPPGSEILSLRRISEFLQFI